MNMLESFSQLPLSIPILVGMTPRLWYALPLIVVVSLVYGATRHENLREIFVHAFRSGVWVLGFMAVIFMLIWVAGFWN
jgi:hypothetical protein